MIRTDHDLDHHDLSIDDLDHHDLSVDDLDHHDLYVDDLDYHLSVDDLDHHLPVDGLDHHLSVGDLDHHLSVDDLDHHNLSVDDLVPHPRMREVVQDLLNSTDPNPRSTCYRRSCGPHRHHELGHTSTRIENR